MLFYTSEIIRKFNIECAVNTLNEMELPNIKGKVLVNVSEDFLETDESLMSIRSILGNTNRENLYNKIIALIPRFRIDIDKMIIINCGKIFSKDFQAFINDFLVLSLSFIADITNAIAARL